MSRMFYALTAAAWTALFYNFPYQKAWTSMDALMAPTPAPQLSWWPLWDNPNTTAPVTFAQDPAPSFPYSFLQSFKKLPSMPTMTSIPTPFAFPDTTNLPTWDDAKKQIMIFYMSPTGIPAYIRRSGWADISEAWGWFSLGILTTLFGMGYWVMSRVPPPAPFDNEAVYTPPSTYYMQIDDLEGLKRSGVYDDLARNFLVLRNGKCVRRGSHCN